MLRRWTTPEAIRNLGVAAVTVARLGLQHAGTATPAELTATLQELRASGGGVELQHGFGPPLVASLMALDAEGDPIGELCQVEGHELPTFEIQ